MDNNPKPSEEETQATTPSAPQPPAVQYTGQTLNPQQPMPVPNSKASQPVVSTEQPNQAVAAPQPNPNPQAQPSFQTQPDQKPVYTTNNTPEPEKHSNGILSFVVTIVVALVLTQIINLFFFQSYRVFGSSMYSTLHDGDRLIVSKVGKTTSKLTNKLYQPKRGQIIVFTSPKDPTLQLIKRVIGLPGERVVVKSGKITIYNSQHPDGFNPDDAEYGKNLPPTSGEADVTVPENNIFVSGDNRTGSNSLDSRNELGTVPEKLIIGTASVRLWPIQNARFF